MAQGDLCTNGTLLFREDFGGNDPNAPAVSTASVPGMSSQYTNSGNSLGSGHYSIRKEGWHNGIQWHWQDDHTYPDDKTRGYLLEIDGVGGSEPFYKTTLTNLCAGTRLTFSAYVVNVTYAGQIPYLIQNFGYVYPRLKFVLKDPATGQTIASKSTGDIQADGRYGTPETWQYARDNQLSAEWQLVGTTFAVPEGVESVDMYIYNDVTGSGYGNDFAIDDIEVRFCYPEGEIEGPKDYVCQGSAVQLEAGWEATGDMTEPLEFKWWHSTDSVTWTEISGATTFKLNISSVQDRDTGWYKAAMSEAGNIDRANCRTFAKPYKLLMKHCFQPCPDGTLLYHQENIGSMVAFSRTLTGFCAGTEITFSTLVTPSLSDPVILVLTDPVSDRELAHVETYFDAEKTETEWHNGKQWYKTGLNYAVPDGISAISFHVENTYNANIDSFEVRLCVPPVTIESNMLTDTVCVDTKNILTAVFENDGSFSEPLEYQWYFSADSLTWSPLAEGTGSELKLKAKPRHTGWYRVAVAGAGNIDKESGRAMSEPFHLYIIDNCPPILCPEGILVFSQKPNGTATPFTVTDKEVCAGSDLSFIAYVRSTANKSPRLLFTLRDPRLNRELGAYDTGEIPADGQCHQVGMNLTVPDGVDSVAWTIKNNAVGVTDNDFVIDSIEVRLCLEPVTITNEGTACRKKPYTLQAEYENYDILRKPEYLWYYSTTKDGNYNEIDEATELSYTIPVIHKSHEGWYKVAVSETGWMAYASCRSESEPFHLLTTYCNTAVEQHIDTTVCDTLLPISWRGHSWPAVGTVTDSLRDIDNDDSVHVHLTLHTQICCPEIQSIRIDSAICDTLLPFLWFFRDTMLLYTGIGEQSVPIPHAKWQNCTGTVYTLALDTFHCERLYPIIVNKYNWQLLLDHTALQRFFPGQTPASFQWFRDSVAIEGATEDDYAEQNELHGNYQLRLRLDDGLYVWSNVLKIQETPEPLPVIKRIYNSNGWLVSEDRMTRGIYIIRYQQGDRVWAEKRIVW